MTNAIDPFAQADGSTSINPNAADPFGQPSGGGDYLKPLDLLGALILLTPVKFEQVPAYQGKPGEMVTRLSADTVVLTGDHAGRDFDAMFWSQKPIVAAAEKAKREGIPALLGTLRRVPIGADKKGGAYDTHEKFEAQLEIAPRTQYAWVLEKFTAEDAQIARAYLASKQPVSPFGA